MAELMADAAGWRASRTVSEMRRVPLRRPWAPYLVGIAGAGAALGASWVGLERAQARLPEWERTVFTSLNGLPDAVQVPAWPIMQLGNFWAGLAAAGAAFAIWRRPAPAVTVGVAAVGAWALAKEVKDVVVRARPADYFEVVHVRQAGLNGYGFVSGHAAVAFAIATSLAPWVPRRVQVVALALAGLVGLCRIYVGAHLPLDVVGGGAIGVACGLIMGLVVGVPAPRQA